MAHVIIPLLINQNSLSFATFVDVCPISLIIVFILHVCETATRR